MNEEIKRYDFKVEYDQFMTPFVWAVESSTGQYCLAYHIKEMQEEIMRLRIKHNDWEDV